MKIHIAPESYECCNCGKSSSALSGASYLKTHTGDKTYMCRKCEKNVAANKTIVHSKTHSGNLQCKGLTLINPGINLCYINATVNAFLNSQTVMNFVSSNLDCPFINKLRALVNSNEKHGSTESLRQFLIAKKT